MSSNLLKCPFCDWECPEWSSSRRGKKTNHRGLLVDHICEEHPERASPYIPEDNTMSAEPDVVDLVTGNDEERMLGSSHETDRGIPVPIDRLIS